MEEKQKAPSKLTKGSHYRVVSKADQSSSITSEGEFLGYLQFGQDSGIMIQLESKDKSLNGTIRIIPSLVVLYIDVLSIKEEEEIKKKEGPLVSYG